MEHVFQQGYIAQSGGNDLFQMIAGGIDNIGQALSVNEVGSHTAAINAERAQSNDIQIG